MALTLCEETTLDLWRSVIKIDSSDLKLWGLETALLESFSLLGKSPSFAITGEFVNPCQV